MAILCRPPGDCFLKTCHQKTQHRSWAFGPFLFIVTLALLGAKMSQKDRTINYIEFSTNNMASTQAFYQETMSWRFTDYGPTYASFSGAGIDGGFALASQAEHKPAGAPLVVLYAADLERLEAVIKEAGGRIVKPIFSFPGGRRFHFLDPAANELAVWSE